MSINDSFKANLYVHMTARDGSKARKIPGKRVMLTMPVIARSISHIKVTIIEVNIRILSIDGSHTRCKHEGDLRCSKRLEEK